ncbi:MAG: carboxylating nicotinate-nucleotide diphosphorylase [Oscillospiraceae bacterium]|nr:carboxylating nicotinate-nucleotide diphosphorylase [Oscillospiraceae bacterium]
MELLNSYVDEVILRALHEDITGMDVTTDFLLDEAHESDAYLMAKDEGVVCGMEIAKRVFDLVGGNVDFEILVHDGERVKYGDILARMHGRTRVLLKGERTALNLLQHLSGIATETRRCADIVSGTKASIADTRKCMVGIRAMQKYAVRSGGGKNHRFNLSDGAMLKDNHIDACGGIIPAITQLRQHIGHMVRIEVEVRTLDELREALTAKADIIMLDNMDCDTMREAVAITDGRALLEASGGITHDTLRAVAETGVDIISIGALTHSVKAFDISMKWGGEPSRA